MPFTEEEIAALTPAKVAELAKTATRLEAQVVAYSSQIQMQWAGNDAILTFGRSRPMMLASGEIAPFAVTEPTAIMHMSPGGVKDFYLVLADQVKKYEAKYGKIETEYSRQLDKAKG